MAVYTDVSFEDLEALLDNYDIGAPTSFKGIAEGVENSNFFLQTTKKSYILTLYEKRVAAADLPFFLGLMEHLSKRGLACPVPVRSKSGNQSFILNGRPGAILSFLEGISLRRPEPIHCAAVGAALGDLHAASQGYAIKRQNDLSLDGWKILASQIRQRSGDIHGDFKSLISNSLSTLTMEWPTALPSGVIHADLFTDNVLFVNGKVSGLIDFYFACNDFYAYDLAIMLNAWCFEQDGAFNLTKAKHLIAGYRSHRELNAEECAAIPILAQGAALRFFLTRLYDWLNTDPGAFVSRKDPLDFVKRLRFHMKAKAPAEYGLWL